MSISLDDICVPNVQSRSKVYRPDELLLKESYLAHLKSSEVLSASGEFWSANIILKTSIECFLKNFYCCVRYTIWDNNFRPSTLHGEVYEHNQFERIFQVKDFNHDIQKLAWYLKNIVIELKSDSDFERFVTNLPRDERWIQERYSFAIDSKSCYQAAFQNLLATFEDVRDGGLKKWA